MSTSWWKLIASLKKLRKAGMKTTTSLLLLYHSRGFCRWENGNFQRLWHASHVHPFAPGHRGVEVRAPAGQCCHLDDFGFVLVMPHAVLCHTYWPTVIPPNHLYKSLIQSALQDMYASTSQSDTLATNTFWYILEEKSLETSKYRSFQWVERSAKFGCHFNHFIGAMVKHIP